MPTRDTAPAGAPCWVDLLTSDAERSRDFYGQVFGWTSTEPQEQFGGYFNFSKDGVLVAGGMPASGIVPAGEPAQWAVYFGTEDADGWRSKIPSRGGSVIRPAEDAPYGRLAEAADPTGVHFKLVAPNAAMPARES